MFTCCWSAKGGAGVTVIASLLAARASRATPTVLVDLCGDVPAAIGISDPGGPGVAEWSRGGAEGPPCDALVRVTGGLSVMPRGKGPFGTLPLTALAALGAEVVVDAGCLDRPDGPRAQLAARADRSLLVTRPCFLALRRAAHLGVRPHGVVVVSEAQRALRAADIAAVLGAPVVAEVPHDPSVSRAVDAGLLLSRCPDVVLAPAVRAS